MQMQNCAAIRLPNAKPRETEGLFLDAAATCENIMLGMLKVKILQ